MTGRGSKPKTEELISKQQVEQFKKQFNRLSSIQQRVGANQLAAIQNQVAVQQRQNQQNLAGEQQLTSLYDILNNTRTQANQESANRLATRRQVAGMTQDRLSMLLNNMQAQSTARYDTNRARQQNSLQQLLGTLPRN